jgi:hypothetical protein
LWICFPIPHLQSMICITIRGVPVRRDPGRSPSACSAAACQSPADFTT